MFHTRAEAWKYVRELFVRGEGRNYGCVRLDKEVRSTVRGERRIIYFKCIMFLDLTNRYDRIVPK